jgi:hypothetical protein
MDLKRINTDKKCSRLLDEILGSNYSCNKCQHNSCYSGKDKIKICKKCKTKSTITRDTIFKGVRFGLVKAFAISIKDYGSNYTLKASEVAIEYKLSIKTARNFLIKIRSDKNLIYKIYNKIDINKKENIEPSLENIRELEAYLKRVKLKEN